MKEKYEELAKRYPLPDLKLLEEDFEVHLIEEEPYLLKSITRKISDKTEYYTKLIEELFHPESDLASMYECNEFTAEEKKDMFNLFKQMVFMHRKAMELEVQYDEAAYATLIAEFYGKWVEWKPQILKIIGKMKGTWIKDSAEIKDSEYFG